MKSPITVVRVLIVRWVDDHNPGWAECHLTDVSGHIWSIVDKLPIFSEAVDLDADSSYPQPGVVACQIVDRCIDAQGRNVLIIDTARPWGISSVDGTTRFKVLEEDIEVIDNG